MAEEVEKTLSKLLSPEGGVTTIEIGNLVARIWPQLIYDIAHDPEWRQMKEEDPGDGVMKKLGESVLTLCFQLLTSVPTVDKQVLKSEEFIGCLFTIANKLSKPANLGLPLCAALIKSSDHHEYAKNKSPISKLFHKLDWGEPVMVVIDNGVTIKLSKKAQEHLEDSGGFLLCGNTSLAAGCKNKEKASTLALQTLKIVWNVHLSRIR